MNIYTVIAAFYITILVSSIITIVRLQAGRKLLSIDEVSDRPLHLRKKYTLLYSAYIGSVCILIIRLATYHLINGAGREAEWAVEPQVILLSQFPLATSSLIVAVLSVLDIMYTRRK